MEEISEKKFRNHRPGKEVCFDMSGNKIEKMEKIVKIIKYNELTFEELVTETRIPSSTLYKYISKLKNDGIIYEDGKKFYLNEEKKQPFNDYTFLKFILPEILHTVKIKKLATISSKKETDEILEGGEEIQKNRSIKTIMVEFNQRGYEQKVAEFLYDKYIDEITMITVGIGGLIIYMSKNNKKSEVYSFLMGFMKRSK